MNFQRSSTHARSAREWYLKAKKIWLGWRIHPGNFGSHMIVHPSACPSARKPMWNVHSYVWKPATWYCTSMLWWIASYQNRVSADQYHDCRHNTNWIFYCNMLFTGASPLVSAKSIIFKLPLRWIPTWGCLLLNNLLLGTAIKDNTSMRWVFHRKFMQHFLRQDGKQTRIAKQVLSFSL